MEIVSDKNITATGIRRKTRKAMRPGLGESNIRLGNTSIVKPSLLSMDKQKIEDSNLGSIFSRKNNFQDEEYPKTVDENKIETRINLNSLKLNNEIEFENKSLINSNFKKDRTEENINTIQNEEKLDKMNSNICSSPFLVGSGSEASYEKNNEIQNFKKDQNELGNVYKAFDEDLSLVDFISNLNNDNLLLYNNSNDIEELSKLFTRMINRFEIFGLNIQSKLEKLEHDLELSQKNDNNCDIFSKSTKYCELLDLKNKLLKQLSQIENEIIEEEIRIKKEENERLMKIEEYNKSKQIYKHELSSLTVIVCWIEDSLQNYLNPLQKKQNEYKQDIIRETEIISSIQDEISKIEKQEKIILDKIREVQEMKRNKGEEKELLEEQIRLSQISKSDKIKNANFKEASLITQTIQVLKQEVMQIEEDYLNVLHQEKEFIEKIERIKKNYIDENNRLIACKNEIFLNRKLKRQELKLKLEELNNCEFSCKNNNLPENFVTLLNDLSSQLNSQVHSVLSFEIGLINKQDQEDSILNSHQDNQNKISENSFQLQQDKNEVLFIENSIDHRYQLEQKDHQIKQENDQIKQNNDQVKEQDDIHKD